MEEFLAPSRYCDADHPDLHSVIGDALRHAGGETQLAIRLFEFVRDEVRYAFSGWTVSASTTLKARAGVCTNKANLLVALLRAARIPAAYGLLRVNPQEYFGNLAPPFLKPLVSVSSLHVYAAVFIGGRWVRCDPSTDAELAAKTSHFCRQTRLVEWDGRQDALDFLQPQHVHQNLGLRACIDDVLDNPPRNAQSETLALINRYLDFIRREPPFGTAEALVGAYWRHMRSELRTLSA